VDSRVTRQENAVKRHSADLRWALPAFASFVKAVMTPAAIFVVALITGRSGVTSGLPIIDLYLSDNFCLEAE